MTTLPSESFGLLKQTNTPFCNPKVMEVYTMVMADKKVLALRSVDHVRVTEAKNGLTYPTS